MAFNPIYILEAASLLLSLGMNDSAERLQKLVDFKTDRKENVYKAYEAEIQAIQNRITKMQNSGAIAADKANQVISALDRAISQLQGYYGKYRHLIQKDQQKYENRKAEIKRDVSNKMADIEKSVASELDNATNKAKEMANEVKYINDHAQELYDAHVNEQHGGDLKAIGDMKALEAALS